MPGPLIALVGVCAAGKTTLALTLRARGYNIRQVSQEHSYVPDLWRRFTHADILIYLDASLDTIRRRRATPTWPEWQLDRQRQRLAVARQQCDFYLMTDNLTREQVVEQVIAALTTLAVYPTLSS